MRIESKYIERELIFCTTNEKWETFLPLDNWCLVLIANEADELILDEIIQKSISNSVGYICGIGMKYDYIHKQSDNEYILRDIGQSNLSKPKYHIMTFGEEDFEEGIWFGLMCTFNRDVEIDKIIIIDTDCKWKSELINLIKKFEEGYLPENG